MASFLIDKQISIDHLIYDLFIFPLTYVVQQLLNFFFGLLSPIAVYFFIKGLYDILLYKKLPLKNKSKSQL